MIYEIPATVLWGAIITFVTAVVGMGHSLVKYKAKIEQIENVKQDKVACIETHGGVGKEIIAMSKDIEMIMRHMKLAPHPSPMRNGGEKKG